MDASISVLGGTLMLLQLSLLIMQAGEQPHPQENTQTGSRSPGLQEKGGDTRKELSECQLPALDHLGRCRPLESRDLVP